MRVNVNLALSAELRQQLAIRLGRPGELATYQECKQFLQGAATEATGVLALPIRAAGARDLAEKYVRTTPTKPGRRFKVDIHVLVETDSPDGEMFWPMTMALRQGVDAEFAAEEIRKAIRLAAAEHAASAVASEREHWVKLLNSAPDANSHSGTFEHFSSTEYSLLNDFMFAYRKWLQRRDKALREAKAEL